MAHEHNIAQHHVETPNNYWQLELLIRGIREGSVVEDAVERNSWGKSRCDQMCCFPNTGGLHRTSGDAPLELPNLRDPSSVNRCVASHTPEDFTAHLEMHPLKHLLCRIQFQCEVMCIYPILSHPNKPRLQESPTKTYSMNW